MGFLDKLRGRRSAGTQAAQAGALLEPDDFPLPEGSERAAEHALIGDLLATTTDRQWYHRLDLGDSEPGRALRELRGEDLGRAVVALLERGEHLGGIVDELVERAQNETERQNPQKVEGAGASVTWINTVTQALEELLRRKPALNADELLGLLRWIPARLYRIPGSVLPIGVVHACEAFAKDHEPTPELRAAVEGLISYLRLYDDNKARTLAARLEKVIGIEASVRLVDGEAWSDAAREDVREKAPEWAELFEHCLRATTGKPSKKWAKDAGGLIAEIGADEVRDAFRRWLDLVDAPRTRALPHTGYGVDPNDLMVDANADYLKGLLWCVPLVADGAQHDFARLLTRVALTAYKKVRSVGPRCVRVGNAAVYALGELEGLDAVGQLALLKVKLRYIPAQKGIDKALGQAAERAGVTREEIEEIGVPAYGLEEGGVLTEAFGDVTAELRVTGTTSTELRFVKPDGKVQKSVPAAVKETYADEVKALKAAAKDIQKMLPAQRERIDGLFLQKRSWPFAEWKERYVDHPLVGTLGRRLLWTFETAGGRASGGFHDGRWVDAQGAPLGGLEGSTVRLWHPIEVEVAEVLAWREWLVRNEIPQPFKQAHREVYVLTDAERKTGTYSNRFAAHILKQHQFHALCGARGWRNSLRLMVDDELPPASRALPAWNLRAELWVEGAGDAYEDVNDAGAYNYVSTDQVRFYPLEADQRTAHAGGGGYRAHGADEAVPLAEVPALVLSEVLRDVDLFVGVASVGNDPAWSDGGARGWAREEWLRFAFGDLSATARTRRDELERLLPKLKIADRCELEDRFLRVRGDLCTYRIHLGSGNILMEPDDRYLCIVTNSPSAAAGRVFLPFEGDRVFSILLSKAFMLAEDRKIQDPTILSQIRRS